ncbi:TIGR03621 family F420-dependent LLM class oxidoreductase [Nocardia sp. NPDC020380]|uniref:TIGR03621 family F420-dependent LLM class oxidoreductase n=1 Tax=Nocardia sp. NPDC020380 TaxID=3364309 RepID=UPI0037B64B04
MVLPFRFGVNMMLPQSRGAWIEKCRRAEQLGYDVIGAPDHLGLPAPFPALMLAADVTERVRLNTFVLNTPFYNPVLLARDVAGLDQLTDGRVELGLGAGYVQAEFEAAGIPFPTAGQRLTHLENTVTTLRRLFTDPEYQPQPATPGGPPILIAGWGERMLRLAAEHADIIAFTGGGTADDGRIIVADSATTEKKTDYARGLLGSRVGTVEFNILVQVVATHAEHEEMLKSISARMRSDFPDDPDGLPIALLGSHQQMAETLIERRERFGFNYITVLEPNMDKLAPVIELLKAV